MLGMTIGSVDAIGESQPIKLICIIAMQTMAGYENLHLITVAFELSLNLLFFRVAEFVGVFGAEARDFTGLVFFDSFRQ